MKEKREFWGVCPLCRNYFLPREIENPCPNCGEGDIQVSDLVFTTSPKKEAPDGFLTLAEALDLDREWGKLRGEIARVWQDHVRNRHWYRGNCERKVRYLQEEGRRFLSGRVNFSLVRTFSNDALKLLVGIVWVKKNHPFGRYSCKCEEEGLQSERAKHRCRRLRQDGGLCGTCLLPVDSRGCWLCRSCGGVLVWEATDWNLPIPKAARQTALNTGV
jgi:hypothetical protein